MKPVLLFTISTSWIILIVANCVSCVQEITSIERGDLNNNILLIDTLDAKGGSIDGFVLLDFLSDGKYNGIVCNLEVADFYWSGRIEEGSSIRSNDFFSMIGLSEYKPVIMLQSFFRSQLSIVENNDLPNCKLKWYSQWSTGKTAVIDLNNQIAFEDKNDYFLLYLIRYYDDVYHIRMIKIDIHE